MSIFILKNFLTLHYELSFYIDIHIHYTIYMIPHITDIHIQYSPKYIAIAEVGVRGAEVAEEHMFSIQPRMWRHWR